MLPLGRTVLPMRESFLLYKSLYEPIKEFSDEDFGILMRAIFEFQINPENPVGFGDKKHIQIAFGFFKNQFRLDDEKYQKVVERNQLNGQKGGRPRISKQTQENPRNPVGLEKPKKPDNENDNENDISIDKSIGETKYGNQIINSFIEAIKQSNNGMVPTAKSYKSQRQALWNCLQLLGVRRGMTSRADMGEETLFRVNSFLTWFTAEFAEKNFTIDRMDTLKQKIHYFLANFYGHGIYQYRSMPNNTAGA